SLDRYSPSGALRRALGPPAKEDTVALTSVTRTSVPELPERGTGCSNSTATLPRTGGEWTPAAGGGRGRRPHPRGHPEGFPLRSPVLDRGVRSWPLGRRTGMRHSAPAANAPGIGQVE